MKVVLIYLIMAIVPTLLAGLLYFKAVKRTKDKLILAGGTTVFSVLIWGIFSMIKTEEKRLLFLKTICYEYDRYE